MERGVVFNLRTEKGRYPEMIQKMPMILPGGPSVHSEYLTVYI